MNKANFFDLFKSIVIIILFIIMIGLIYINTNPNFIRDIMCKYCKIEGFSNTKIDECNLCNIIPLNVSGIQNSIFNIFNRSNNQYNLYFIYQGKNYLFSMWRLNNSFNENCTTLKQRSRTRPCCLLDDNNSQASDFYQSNYITVFNSKSKEHNKINGIIFEVTEKIQDITPENKYQNFKYTYRPYVIKETPETFIIRDKNVEENTIEFTYNSNIKNDKATELTINVTKIRENKDEKDKKDENKDKKDENNNFLNTTIGNVDYEITCNGKIKGRIRDITNEDCNIERIPIDKALLNQRCWNLPRNVDTRDVCSLQSIPMQNDETCNVFMPRDPEDDFWNNINNNNNNRRPGTFNDTNNNFDLTTPEIRTILQRAADKLVSKFTQRMNNFEDNFGQRFGGIEFPNIGSPTFLNIGRCNSNSPFVFNSSCNSNNDNNDNDGQTTSGGFLYKYNCYPSITGQFEVCGPKGYMSRPEFS